MANADVKLKLDMFATVELPTTFQRRTVAVPEGAVQQLEGKNVVFVQKGPTSFEPRPVQAGKTVNGLIEIMSGLSDGEPVVAEGAFHLKAIVAGKELGEE
jgi:cobalt-zinc-cadmium efflux system membrane fusion protein